MTNILKKILSSILNLVLLIAITTLCAIFVARNLLSGDNLIGIIKNPEVSNSFDYSTIIPDTENSELYKNLDEYIDTEQIGVELEKIIMDTLKYSSGIPGAEAPNIEELKEMIHNSRDKYEEATGEKINLEDVDKQLDELEDKLTSENSLSNNEKYKMAFNFIYNDKYIYISIALIILCIILILLLNEIESLIKHLIAVSIFNGVGNYGFGLALNKIIGSEGNNIASSLVDNLTNTFNQIAITSFIIAGTLIIILIVIKIIKGIINSRKLKENKAEENIPEEQLSNENITQENNIEDSLN